jgi:hypothetical protein
MANIYVEAKGPQGVQAKESLLPAAVSGFNRGLAVAYGADAYHCALIAAAAAPSVLGLIEEDAINVNNPVSVIEFGQAVAQIGATVAAQQALTVNAAGQLVPAQPGQPVVAIALESQVYVSPGSFANVMVIAILGITLPGDQVNYIAAAGAIPIVTGTYALNGAGALAMTLAAPTAAQDGTVLTIVAATAHAHTVTAPANTIEGTKDTVTYAAAYDIVVLKAVNLKWAVVSIGGPTPAALSEV